MKLQLNNCKIFEDKFNGLNKITHDTVEAACMLPQDKILSHECTYTFTERVLCVYC